MNRNKQFLMKSQFKLENLQRLNSNNVCKLDQTG